MTGASSSLAHPGGSPVGTEAWSDVTSGPLADPGTGFGVAWGDYDGDGDHDLCVGQFYSTPFIRLFRNDGAGLFADATGTPPWWNDPTHTGVWGDADNDGDLDLLQVHDFEPSHFLHRNSGGTFSLARQFGTKGGVGGAAWGDYDRDGDLDLVVVNHAGLAVLHRNEGQLSFAELPWLDQALNPIWVDYDGDGDLDLNLVAPGGSRLRRNDGGTFGVNLQFEDGNAAAWGDYDNDGDPDLYVAKPTGPNRMFRNDGNGAFNDVTAGTPLALDGDSRDAGWVDYDNDGDLDLFVIRGSSANVLFRNDGDGAFANTGSSALDGAGQRRAAAWADYDGDGDLDVYVASDTSAGRLIRNDLAPGLHHWLHVDLVGVHSNRNGVGARIRIKSGGVWHMQDVSGGSGHSQGSLTAEFGLGTSTVADSILVHWPSTIVQTLTAVPADQRIEIVEAGTTATPDRRWFQAELFPPAPNPSWGSTAVRFDLAAGQRVRLEILDVAGRHIRTIADAPMPTGRHDLSWDGRDAEGGVVRAGVYWVRLETGTIRQTRRFIRLR